jgi:hypothetical protein
LASTDPTAPVVTVQCELGNCHRCRGQVISLVAPAGTRCACDCHGLVDLAVEARLEAEHFGSVA